MKNGKFTPDPKPEKKEKKKKGRIKPVGVKRAKQNVIYTYKRKIYLEDNPNCQIKLSCCTIHATDIHHSYSGKDRNKYYLNIDTWFSTCRNCHNFVHDNPKEARELNYLK